jgi:hypothetical protein
MELDQVCEGVEVKELKAEARQLKETLAEVLIENRRPSS